MNILGLLRSSGLYDLDACQYYRAFLPLNKIDHSEAARAKCITTPDTVAATDADLKGRDLYVISRMYGPTDKLIAFVEWIHDNGGRLVFDADDDLTERYRLVSGRGDKFIEALGMVDYVTTTTPYLADYFSQWTQNEPVVLPNHLDCEWFVRAISTAKRAFPGYAIGFSGSPTHWGDWYTAAPAFSRIAEEYSHIVQPLAQGDPPSYLNFVDRLIKLPAAPYCGYPLALAQFDVVLCAVDGRDPFNLGKSNVKPLEVMMAGALPICSRFVPYVDLYERGAPIKLVEEDSVDGWYEAMQWAVDNREEVDYMSGSGASWVAEHYDMASGYKLWLKAYEGFVD